ncbi:MAG: S8 family serine peptidase [Eubacterium sp.]|nr:S8 family serine peptidase [Eubacterium sp.]
MKKRILAIALSLALMLSAVPSSALAQEDNVPANFGTPGVDYVTGEAVVCVTGGAAALNRTGGLARRAAPAYETQELMVVEEGASVSDETSVLLRSAAADTDKSLVLVKSDQDTESLIAELEDNPNVAFAEPNYYLKPCGVEAPTDEGYPYQWALENRLNSGAADPSTALNPAVDINAEEAWEAYTPASDKPVVAVMDTGVDYEHPDLKNIMWDDGLKYDTLTAMGGGQYGYNVLGNVEGEKGTDDPMDTDIGHGTHCAGIIAAQWNNDEGIAGVSPNAEIMAVRFMNQNGGATNASAIQGYAYIQAAAKAGVNLVAINNSWGVGNYDGKQLHSISTAVTALGQEYGVVSCFGAGNNEANNDRNTGGVVDSPYAVKVGAMDSQGYRSYFSCWGQETVDVFAPGSQILSAVTTYEDEAYPTHTHNMPRQYLPQIQDDADDYFYEDFEGDAPKTGLRLLDAEGKVVENAKAATALGYDSAKSLSLPLDSIEEGQSFAIELTFDRQDIEDIAADERFYIAFQGGCDNAMYGQTFLIQYQNADGQWVNIDATQITGQDANGNPTYMPARLRLYDHSWDQSSQEVNLADFGQYINDSDPDTVALRLVPSQGVMSGKTGDTAAFRLDDFGFGRQASNYFYSDGTSMATPVVTGLAALLSETFNDQETKAEHAAEICARIKGGVNRDDAQQNLTGASMSDGFIDAGAAFDDSQCVPVLNDLTIDEKGQATLKGYFFGSPGSLTVGGKAANIVSWDEHTITFDLPEGVNGKQEIVVIPEGKDYGRNFFSVGLAAKAYDSLSAPALDLGEYEGYPITSADLFPVAMGATDSYLAYAGCQLETDDVWATVHFSVYNIATDTWSSVNLPEGDILGIASSTYYSLTGGKTKFYLLYNKLNEDDTEMTAKIGTYDPVADSWTVVDAEGLSGTEGLVVYQDQLLAIGGDDEFIDETSGAVTTRARSSVKIVDPSTGKTTGRLPDMPQGRSGAIVSASGGTLTVTGGTDGVYKADAVTYTNTLSYDGTAWTVHNDNLLATESLDSMQTLDTAYTAVNGGMMAVGPVADLGKDIMRDTWSLSLEDDLWSADENRLYSQSKITRNTGAASGGKFYVLGYTGKTEEPLIFRATDVDYTGPTADPGSDSAVTPTPEPQPETNPTTPTGDTDVATAVNAKNTNTGIFENSAGQTLVVVSALVLAALGGFVCFKKRRNG